ncbi:LOW QUALITY PROTEIN: netrin-4 [Leucoraja erinacea]|uniref:LOW QUALITY PROTEIN: netrin-4 n=1 Tax=Leucoraja erinaceus TaxID=7782 RepID=UPI0024579014|nr:LOW QUALITY PROTEIN: netrin-4 [Leucoraja erinacea]
MRRLWLAVSVLLSLGGECRPAGLTDEPGVRQHCVSGACNPQLGNLVAGRHLKTTSTCGAHSTELYCAYTGRGCRARAECGKCASGQSPRHSHPAAAMTDSSFRFPRTWWQSAQGRHRESIQLDLETHFYFTHLIIIFKSPRPAAMILERSQDFGSTWKPYKYFARNCSDTFGLTDDQHWPGASCTSRYSDPVPCTRGEVIFRALSPPRPVRDPYSLGAQERLRVTNLRVRMLKRQACPCSAQDSALKPQAFAHYAIYDFIAMGSCFCNGHAERCEPAEGFAPDPGNPQTVIHGKCICEHHTMGEHCGTCTPLYNDCPWRPADGKKGLANQCQKCKCNGHAQSCHFDLGVWLASGNRSGGVCDHCGHNTQGHRCQLCQPGFFRNLHVPQSAVDTCLPCSCHGVGSTSVPLQPHSPCDADTGQCLCKPGVAGPRCDKCLLGYWGLGQYGCRPCDCAGSCDPYTGDCIGSPADTGWHRGSPSLALSSGFNGRGPTWNWEEEQGFSALRHSGKCECRSQVLKSPQLFCSMKFTYVLKVKILSAHDKGSHAEVNVKVKKVFKRTKLKIQREKWILYPESWTTRGCTCPVLNPGMEYLIAGHEDARTGRLVVNMKSFVQAWRSDLGRRMGHILRSKC